MLLFALVLGCSTGEPAPSGWLPLGSSDLGSATHRSTAPGARAPAGTVPPDVRVDPFLGTTDLVRVQGVERVQLCSGGDLQPV